MPTETLHDASVTTQANVYFEGKCISHSLTLPGGVRKSVGVVLPATLRFNTVAPEVMECVAGSCDYRLDGEADWRRCGPGERFHVGANSAFDIRVADAYHYICHFG